MFEAFVLLLMAVIACAAWQFIPAFRSLVKATLMVASIMIALGALGYAAYNGSVIADKAIGGAVAFGFFGLVIGLARALTRKAGGSMPRWRNGVRVRE